jgi:hypothetical protein
MTNVEDPKQPGDSSWSRKIAELAVDGLIHANLV